MNKKRIIQLLRSNNNYINYFVQKIREKSNPEKYLELLMDEGFFNWHNNPTPIKNEKTGGISFPNWPILDYLEFVTEVNEKKGYKSISSLVLKIVNDIISHRNKNYITDWKIIKILSFLPTQYISKNHFDFFSDSLKVDFKSLLIGDEITSSFIPKFLNEKKDKLMIQLTKSIINFRKNKKGENYSNIVLLENYYFLQGFHSKKEKIAELCGEDIFNFCIDKIEEILKLDKEQFSKWKINSIHAVTNDLQMSNDFSPQIICLVTDMIENLDPIFLKIEIQKLIKKKHPIFKRIGLYGIKVHFIELNNLFWDWDGNPLDSSSDFLRLEVYELIEKNANEIVKNKSKLKQIIDWIENAYYYLSEKQKNNDTLKNQYLAYKKREWLTALIRTENEEIIKKHKEYEEIYDAVIDHPGHDLWIDSFSGVKSPFTKEEIFKKKPKETLKFIKNFNADSRDYKDPQPEGLKRILREFVTAKPEFFINDLNAVLVLDYIYISSFIWGYYEAWRNNNYFDWEKILKFSKNVVNIDTEENTSKYIENINYKESTYSAILHLLEEGMKNDDHAFDLSLLDKAEEIMFILVSKIKSGSHLLNETSIVNKLINSDLGNLLSCMIVYSLRYARNIKDSDKFAERVKDHFEKIVNSDQETSWEYYATWGRYLPQLMYLDKDWVEKNFDKILNVEIEESWKICVSAFFESSQKVFKDIYTIFIKKGIFEKALEVKFEDQIVSNKMIQQIVIGYFQKWDEKNSEFGLINKVLSIGKSEQIQEIVRFISGADKGKNQKEISFLWDEIIKICRKHEGEDEFKEVLASIWQWIKLDEEIKDENIERLKFSIPYFKEFIGHYAHSFGKFLNENFSQYPEKMIELFQFSTKNDVYFRFSNYIVREILEKVYEEGKKDIGDSICNKYAEAGMIEMVKPVYEKYNEK